MPWKESWWEKEWIFWTLLFLLVLICIISGFSAITAQEAAEFDRWLILLG